jgi:hypothetical protein
MKIIMGDFSKSLLTRLMQPVCRRSAVWGSTLSAESVTEMALLLLLLLLLVEVSFWSEDSALLWRSKRGKGLEDLLTELSRRDENVCFQCSNSCVSCWLSFRGAGFSRVQDASVIDEE